MRRSVTLLAAALLAAAGIGLGTPGAHAQQGPGGLLNPERDCQTVTTCNFGRTGSYRGCLSSYSCRVCKLVTARCSIGGSSPRQKVCQEMRCTWGA